MSGQIPNNQMFAKLCLPEDFDISSLSEEEKVFLENIKLRIDKGNANLRIAELELQMFNRNLRKKSNRCPLHPSRSIN